MIRFTNNSFTSLTVTDLLTCCQEMLVTHLEFLNLATLWNQEEFPPNVNIHFFIRK